MELITPGLGLLFWMSVTFLILLFILGKFAWPVMTKMIKERETLIAESLVSAQKAKEEMAQLKANNEALLKEAMEQRDKILSEANQMGEKIRQQAQGHAQQEAAQIVAAARQSINYEKLQALAELKNQIASFSIDIAQSVLGQELQNKEADQKLIDRRVEDFKVN
jgi:ATP synthase, F0 subunit b